jgi:hypothetical protein
MPRYFSAHFEEMNGSLVLRSGEESFRRRLVGGYAVHQEHVALIAPLIREVALGLAEEPAVNAQVKKLLSADLAPDVFYATRIGPSVRPNVYLLEKELGEFFVRDAEGRLYVPESRKAHAQAALVIVKAIDEGTEDASGPIATFGESLAPFDDLHKRLKKAAPDKLFVSVVLKKAMGQPDAQDPAAAANRVKEATSQLEERLAEATVKTPAGRVLAPEPAEKIAEMLDQYERAVKLADALRDAAGQLSELLRKDDPVCDEFRKALPSDIVVALIAEEVAGDETDPVSFMQAELDKLVVRDDGGLYRVREERAAEVAGELKDPDRFLSEQARGIKIVSLFGERMKDPELKTIFSSFYGKHEVEQATQAMLASQEYDGLTTWIEACFDSSGGKLKLKPAARQEIKGVIDDARKIENGGSLDDGGR